MGTEKEPGPWTAEVVERWLVIAHGTGPDRSPGIAAAINWIPEYVTPGRHQVKLHTWAWARANGHSLREICRERGWPWESFQRKRREAVAMIVDRLNEVEKQAQRKPLTMVPAASDPRLATDERAGQ